MNPHRRHGNRVVVGAAIATIVVLSGCGSDGSSPGITQSSSGAAPAPTATSRYDAVIHLTVSDGKVTGDTTRARVKRGQVVAIIVQSDVADEIHLHGYNKMVDVAAGGTATLVFTANIPGVFVVELEHRSKELTMVEVS